MGKYPPALLKGMAMRVVQAESTSEANKAFALKMMVSAVTGLDINEVDRRIKELAAMDVPAPDANFSVDIRV